MSTRGLYGYINGEERVAEYNSHDSYPDGLGKYFFDACKSGDMSDYQVYEDDISFIQDSLFCEWAYFYDIEKRIFEIWSGFQTEADANNPYGQSKRGDYYPCKRILRVYIDKIPDDFFDGIEDTKSFENFCKSFQRGKTIDDIID